MVTSPSLTADVRMGRKNLAYISAEHERKKDVHNQGSSLPWLWTVGGILVSELKLK